MIKLKILQEPIMCPICKDKERVGFLRTVMESDRGTIGGLPIEFECSHCHALFGVER